MEGKSVSRSSIDDLKLDKTKLWDESWQFVPTNLDKKIGMKWELKKLLSRRFVW